MSLSNPVCDLADAAAKLTGVAQSRILSNCRGRRASMVRFAIWLVCTERGWTQEELAAACGRADHSVVSKGLRRAAQLMAADGWFRELVDHLRMSLSLNLALP